MTLSATAYLWLKALHLIFVIAWMAGLFYLPRLFVYHTQAKPGSDQSELFKVMERRLYRAIMVPALVLTLVFGGFLLANADWQAGWLQAKLVLLVGMVAFHVACGVWKNGFAKDANRHSEKFYRVANEIPTLLMIGIVLLAVLKPF